MIPVFTLPRGTTDEQAAHVAQRLRLAVERGEIIVLTDEITLRFVSHDPDQVHVEVEQDGARPAEV